MKTFVRMAAAAALLLLAACAPRQLVRQPSDASLLREQGLREQALRRFDHWALQGKLALSNGKDGGSGMLTWTQDGAQYRFELRMPITGKSFQLTGDSDGARLQGLDGGPRQGPDAESLMRDALGWDVPLAELRAWVLGARAATSASSAFEQEHASSAATQAQLQFGVNRLPSLLQQDGWSVDYRKWDLSRQPPLPLTLFADKPPYKVKLAIQSWSVP